MTRMFEPKKDFNYYKNSNKVFWVVEHDLAAVFKRFAKVPCIYVEKFKDGKYGIIQFDLSITNDPYQYTAWRKLIGQDFGFRIDVLLIDAINNQLYNLQGDLVSFEELRRSDRHIDKEYLGRMSRMKPLSVTERNTFFNTFFVTGNSLRIAGPVRDLKYYSETNKIFWVFDGKKPVGNFKLYDKIPCIFVEKFKDGSYGIIQLDPSINNNTFQYTAWRKLIGEQQNFIAEVLLIDKSKNKLYNLDGEEVAYHSLTLSARVVGKENLAPTGRISKL